MKSINWTLAALALSGAAACATNPAPAPAPQATSYVVAPAPAYGSNTCADCGTVNSVTQRQTAGKANVAGAVIGAVVGGVAGHQFGSGKGNTAATAGGAVVGGIVGSQVGKDAGTTAYDVVIRMDNGATQTMTVAATGGLHTGSRVRISGNQIMPM